MPRPCSVCHSSSIADISADIANGVTDKEISRRYSLSKSSVQRHRQHLGAPNSATVVATKGAAFAALAALPTREEAGSALSGIGARIDAIAAKAEQEGSLAVALMGLKELRSQSSAGEACRPHRRRRNRRRSNQGQCRSRRGGEGAHRRHPPPSTTPPSSPAHLGDADLTPTRSSGWRRSSMVSESPARDRPPSALHAQPSAWCRRELKLELDPWQVRMVDAPAGLARHRAHPSPSRQDNRRRRSASPTRWCGASREQPQLGARADAPAKSEVDPQPARPALDGRRAAHRRQRVRDRAANGSRALALPGADDASIRGLSIDGDCVVDEAARVSDALYEAARPMLIRHAETARLILFSTAWARKGFFYRIWTEGDPRDWLKIEARVDECQHISKADLERERRSMPPAVFAREYENVFDSLEARFFDADVIAAAFGAVSGPTPPMPDGDPDPVVSRAPAFDSRSFRMSYSPAGSVDLEQVRGLGLHHRPRCRNARRPLRVRSGRRVAVGAACDRSRRRQTVPAWDAVRRGRRRSGDGCSRQSGEGRWSTRPTTAPSSACWRPACRSRRSIIW